MPCCDICLLGMKDTGQLQGTLPLSPIGGHTFFQEFIDATPHQRRYGGPMPMSQFAQLRILLFGELYLCAYHAIMMALICQHVNVFGVGVFQATFSVACRYRVL